MKPIRWLAIILIFTALTMVCTYFVSSDPAVSPLAYIRYAFGIIFVVVVPGYCLINILFRKRNRLDIIEQAVLSVALSFGIIGLVGLFLGLSPIRITFISITVSITGITLALAIIAFILKIRKTNLPEQQNTNQPNSFF
jgi:uncharacterized membrane protein